MESAAPRSVSLRARLGLVALVFLVLVFVAVGLSALMLRSWDRTLDRRVEARHTANEVAELTQAFTDQETGLLAYQLSADPVVLATYREGDALARSLLERLDRRDGEIDGLEEQLLDVAVAADRWTDDVAVPIVDDPAGAPTEELARLRFEKLRAELDDVDALATAQLAELDEDVQRLRRNVFGVLFASAAAAVAGTALAAMLFRRWVIQPLHQVGVAARALAVDDTYPLPRFDSPELQDVSDAVASLQRSLSSARDDAVAAYIGLEQSAVLALQVRTQLADEIGRMPPGWAAESMLVPAEGVVAGDCFDVGLLDLGRVYVVEIDVTGHGASAALDALKAKSQLRAAIRSGLDPGPAIDWVSREMLKDQHSDLLTATVMIIDLASGAIRYANAGHPTAKLTDGEHVLELQPTGPLVGAFEAAWTTEDVVLPPGWTVLVHTDGLVDTVGPERERFGPERLVECLTDPEPGALLARIREAVDAFRVGPRTDDTTAIAIHRMAAEDVDRDQSDTGDVGAADRGTVQP